MSNPQPIETRYAGCRFRSRLEARWGVFFNHLGIRWQYEPEGYTLTTGNRYLPDFYLPDLDQWVEVKGKMTHHDFLRITTAATELPAVRPAQIRPGVLILGSIPEPEMPYTHSRAAALDGNILWQQTFFTSAGTVQPIRESVVFRLDGLRKMSEGRLRDFVSTSVEAAADEHLALSPAVNHAYIAARSARFEHGENG